MKVKKPTKPPANPWNDTGRPTAGQVRTTQEVVRWYLGSYFRTPEDLGLLGMFCDAERVGAFAVSPAALRRGDPAALFRVLVVTTMFQRLRDALVFKILRGISARDVVGLTTQSMLLAAARASGCAHLRGADSLRDRCDLTKVAGKGTCGAFPNLPCPLKRHTVLLKRYGHFGKMPTSAALVLEGAGGDLASVLRRVFARTRDAGERADLLLSELTRIWRVSDKIAAMFLSAITNKDLGGGLAPWIKGIDSSHFIVIDSNVDLFLATIGYRGRSTYRARRAFVAALARRIDLRELRPDLDGHNPRLVQQAMYTFMGRSNRRENREDCMHRRGACATCPRALRAICPVRTA